jgi:hypothetical protein
MAREWGFGSMQRRLKGSQGRNIMRQQLHTFKNMQSLGWGFKSMHSRLQGFGHKAIMRKLLQTL